MKEEVFNYLLSAGIGVWAWYLWNHGDQGMVVGFGIYLLYLLRINLV